MFPSFWWTNTPPWGTEKQVGIKFWDILNQTGETLSSLLPFSSHFRLCPTLWRALTCSSSSMQPSRHLPWNPFWLRCDTCLLCAHLREERFWKKGTWTPKGRLQMGPEWGPHRHNPLVHRLCLPLREENHQRRTSTAPRSGLCLLQSRPDLSCLVERGHPAEWFYFLIWIRGLCFLLEEQIKMWSFHKWCVLFHILWTLLYYL